MVRSPKRVSIPFIAGQWSLPTCAIWAASSATCFNPLHCGAVVASFAYPPCPLQAGGFQSPSLRGSGRFLPYGRGGGTSPEFQSPSLRGSGRFESDRGDQPDRRCEFQSPSLRGSGRFRAHMEVIMEVIVFQSPSLRGSGRFGRAAPPPPGGDGAFQSPSLRGSGRFHFRL